MFFPPKKSMDLKFRPFGCGSGIGTWLWGMPSCKRCKFTGMPALYKYIYIYVYMGLNNAHYYPHFWGCSLCTCRVSHHPWSHAASSRLVCLQVRLRGFHAKAGKVGTSSSGTLICNIMFSDVLRPSGSKEGISAVATLIVLGAEQPQTATARPPRKS